MKGAATRDWALAVAGVAAILAAVPFVRAMQRWVQATVGSQAFLVGTVVVILAAAVVGAVRGWRRLERLRWRSLAWAVVLAAVASLWSLRLWEPEEAVHLVEYGLLGVLLYRALRHHVNDAAVLLIGAVIGATVGTVDELVQWLTPERYFDYRDVNLNLGASVLVQAGLWLVAGVDEGRRRPSRASLRCWLVVLSGWLLVLGFCLAATPQRCQRWAERTGWSFLTDPDDVVSEYGHRHEAEGIGVFRSRFTLDELLRQDAERTDEVAAVLDEFHRHERYREFLDTHTSGRSPFIHEARVHIFSRNSHTADGRKTSGEEAREHFTVAYREQLILERFFGACLGRSKSRIGRRWREELERGNDPSRPFESRVSAHLITRVSEGRALALVAAALVTLAGLWWWLGRPGRR